MMSLISAHFLFYLIANLNAQTCFKGAKCDSLISAGDPIIDLISNNGDFQYSMGPSVFCSKIGVDDSDLPCLEGLATDTFAITFNPDLCVQSVGFKYWVNRVNVEPSAKVRVVLKTKAGEIVADDVMETSIHDLDQFQSITYFMELQLIGIIEIIVDFDEFITGFQFDPTLFEYCVNACCS